ncbi:MAG: tetratricopeptide repeat protein [Sterolibacterium sp.]|nr:tetratricopeptide repeat protein [Sterolibacterium sp.]
MSFLMDELKKAERATRPLEVPPSPQPIQPPQSPVVAEPAPRLPPRQPQPQLPQPASSLVPTKPTLPATSPAPVLLSAALLVMQAARSLRPPRRWLGWLGVGLLSAGLGAAAMNFGLDFLTAEKSATDAAASGTPLAAEPQPSAQHAYTALMSGQLEAARAEYQRLLAVEPGNLDALHGLATLSQHAGQNEAAQRYYQQVLALAPRDVRAQLALANLQADAGHWPQAQQAFLEVYRQQPDNPDVLYSLAVSFDHLQQGQQARIFYRLALAAAKQFPASFDRERAVARVAALGAML